MKKIKSKLSAVSLAALFAFFALPAVNALAQVLVTPPGTAATSSYCPGNTNDFAGILHFFICLITGAIIPLLITLGIASFIYGVVRYVINANDSAAREEGKQFMIWGIIGLFVIVSIWGLIKLLTGTFGFNFVIPQLQQ
jgi:hypothetical protein